MNNIDKWKWEESLPILENIIVSDYGIYDIVAKIGRENIQTNIYRAKIEKDSVINFSEHDNKKIVLVLQGRCVIDEQILDVGSFQYIPDKHAHTLTTLEKLELLVIKFNTRR